MKLSREDRYKATLEQVLAAGEGSKTFLKTGQDAANWLYEQVREKWNDSTGFSRWQEIPFNLCHVREAKHAEIFGADFWKPVSELVEIRETIKAMPVLVRAPKEESVEQKIRRTLAEEIKRRKEKFDFAKRSIELFAEFVFDEKMGMHKTFVKRLHTEVVHCSNSFGTNWTRIDWYLDGKKTAFQFIMGAIDEVKRERGIK